LGSCRSTIELRPRTDYGNPDSPKRDQWLSRSVEFHYASAWAFGKPARKPNNAEGKVPTGYCTARAKPYRAA
jgi:hypothetical protein